MEELDSLIRKANRYSYIISGLYVGIATIAVLCSYPPYYGDWVLYILFLTFPVSIISFGVMIAGKQYFLVVIVIQIIIFWCFKCWVLSLFVKKIHKTEIELQVPWLALGWCLVS